MAFIEWLAGFFDGEGGVQVSIYINNEGRVMLKNIIGIFNSKLNILEYIRDNLGFGIIYYNKHKEETVNKLSGKIYYGSGCYKLSFHNYKDVKKIANMLLPYVVLKKEHLQIVLKFIEIRKKRQHRKITKEVIMKCFPLVKRVYEINENKIRFNEDRLSKINWKYYL